MNNKVTATTNAADSVKVMAPLVVEYFTVEES